METGRLYNLDVFNIQTVFYVSWRDVALIFARVGETSALNVSWWNMWTLNFHFPFLRHVSNFVIGDEDE